MAFLHGVRTRGGQNIGIILEGDWLKLGRLTSSIDITMAAAAAGAQLRFAKKYRDKVKSNILNGGKRLGLKPLQPSYKKFKTQKGGGGRALVWSQALYNAVEVMTLRGGRVGIGIDRKKTRGQYNHESESPSLTISEYANILEHGSASAGIVARPVFRETFKQHMGGIKGLQKFIQWHLIRDFNKQGIRLNKL